MLASTTLRAVERLRRRSGCGRVAAKRAKKTTTNYFLRRAISGRKR